MKIEELRKHIDEIDERIFSLLQERLKFVGQVGKVKKSSGNGQYIIRAGREALKVKKAFQQSKEAGLNDKISLAIASIWREIISLSINFEEEAKIAYKAKSTDTLWMLREYFGPYSDKIPCKNDDEILEKLKNKKANIAAFEIAKKSTSEPWWLKLSKQTSLAVFASLPLFPIESQSSSKQQLSTLLVSAVTPEPSGDDKFIYVISQKIPAEDKSTFKIISEYKGNYLVTSDEFYNNYQSKLKAKYLGCVAVLKF